MPITALISILSNAIIEAGMFEIPAIGSNVGGIPEVIIDNKTGFLDVNLPENIENDLLKNAQIVLNTLVVGINSVIESYPKYVTLQNREV